MVRHRPSMSLFFLLSCTLIVNSCRDGPLQPEREPAPVHPNESQTGSPKKTAAQVNWEDGSTIRVQVDTVGGVPSQWVRDQISAAAQAWNDNVFDLDGYDHILPHFVDDTIYTVDVSKPKISIDYYDYYDQGDGGWCGEKLGWTIPPTDSTYVLKITKVERADSASYCGGRVVDDLDGVVSHEMSHAFGLYDPDTDETAWCAANVPVTGNLNASPCSWEQQKVYAAYELRTDFIPDDSLLATSVEILTAVDSVYVDSTMTIRVAALSGPEPSSGGGAPDTVSAEATWSSSNTSVLGISSPDDTSVVVTGVARGTADLIVTADPANTTVWPWPADTVSIVVAHSSGLDPCFDQENTHTARYVDQFLEGEAVCGSTGSGYQYRWRFKHTDPWTAYSTNPKYEFVGHSTADSFQVYLDVKKTETGDTAQVSKWFHVGSTIISLTGPTYVTDKLLKTYTASQIGDWYERYNPDQYDDWGTATSTNSSTYNRIWAAGEYDVALRNTKTVSGELRRRRLDIEVCWQCQAQLVADGNLLPGVGDGTRADEWGIFGAGPWITGGTENDPELARFYDLTGLHDEGTPFAEPTWLMEGDGVAYDSRSRWNLAWTKLGEVDPDARGFEFTVTPLTGESYEFGFAIDPDLGSPVDDESGYDPTRGMVYVFDGEMAVGFLLLGSGGDALSKVREYGARSQAPRAEAEAWSASREDGIQLAPGPDDVQLLLSADPATGPASWELWIVRGSSVTEIQQVADIVLSQR